MNLWKEKIENSEGRLRCVEFIKLLEESEVNFELENDWQDYIDRALLISKTVLSRIDDNDPRLINMDELSGLANQFVDAIANYNSWLQGNDETILTTTVNNRMDIILKSIPALVPAQDLKEARSSITSLRHSVARHRTIVDSEIESLIEKRSEADKSIDEKVEEASSEFSTLSAQLAELTSELESVRSASAQVTTEQQTAFTKAEADRSTTFSNLVSDKQKELTEAIKEQTSTVSKAISDLKEKVAKDEEAAAAARVRVEEILEVVGDEALTGDYSKNARQEKKSANNWRFIAAGSLLAAIGIAIYFSFGIDATTSWQKVVAKTVIVTSFGGLAGYAAKQSGEHRDAQRNAERMSLQLKAIKPYLGDLDDKEKQDNLLVTVADRLFGKEPPAKDRHKIKEDEHTVALTQLTQAIADLVRMVRPK